VLQYQHGPRGGWRVADFLRQTPALSAAAFLHVWQSRYTERPALILSLGLYLHHDRRWIACVFASVALTKVNLLRLWILPLVAAVASLSGCAHIDAPARDHYFRTVSFPHVSLAEGERIESVEIVMGCGRFRAINRIPNDWSAEVVGPSSEISTFKAYAGHGSTELWSSRDLDNFITIMDCEPSCFTIKATMVVSTANAERTISFTQSDLILKPAPKMRP
jgi:hypothetical protein